MLRSALTVLGVTIGIAAVICVVALGTAGSDQIQEQLRNMGDNAIWIEAGGRTVNGIRTGGHASNTLTLDDAVAMKKLPLIKSVSPHVDSHVQVVYKNQNWSTSYRGVSPAYLDIRRWTVSVGMPFTQADVDQAANVALLGQTVAAQLFGDDEAVGKVVRVSNVPFTVVGVLEAKGQSAYGQDQDDNMLLPYTTAMSKIAGKTWLDDILCSAVSDVAISAATEEVTSLLRERHKIRPGQDDDFNIRKPEEVMQARLESSHIFTLLLISIASVSLLIGGIGIMNVMLVSVTERTREIGIRLAIGAQERDIQLQFLGEAVILSLFGGSLGVCGGVIGSSLLGRMLSWPMIISLQAIFIAAVFSFAVGIGFGFYPAQKASRLDPIDALRYE